MATTVTAHRDERRLIGIDFTDDLPSGAAISSVDFVEVYDSGGNEVTSEVRGAAPVAPSLSGAVVSFWKEIAASASEQVAGTYKVKCRVILDNAEEPIALGEGDRLILLRIVGD